MGSVLGCEPDRPRALAVDGPFAGVIDTLDGGTILTRSPAASMWTPAGAWRLVPDLVIGAEDGTESELFGYVAAIETDSAGRIYVADQQAHAVRVFDRSGRHLRTLGRKGAGPGELDRPSGLFWKNGALWVVDQRNGRFTTFDASGIFVASHRRDRGATWGTWLGGTDRAGRIYDMISVSGGREPAATRLGENLLPVDTFIPGGAPPSSFELAQNGGVTAVAVPFSPRPVWRIAPEGNVWTGTTDRLRLALVSFGGDTLRVVERDHVPEPVSAGERDSALQAIGWFREMGGAIDERRIPRDKPAYNGIHLGDDGSLWLHTTNLRRGVRVFYVFDSEGRYLGSVTPPQTILPDAVVIRGGSLLAVAIDDLGVQRVVRFRIEGAS